MFTRKGKFDGQIVNFNKTSRLNQVFFLSLLTNYRRNKRETRFLKLPSSPPSPSPPSPPIKVSRKYWRRSKRSSIEIRIEKLPPPPPLPPRFIFLHVPFFTRSNYDASSGERQCPRYFVPREQISSLSLETERSQSGSHVAAFGER